MTISSPMLDKDEEDGCEATSTHDSTTVRWADRLGDDGDGGGDGDGDIPSKRRGCDKPGLDLEGPGCDMLLAG